MDKQEQSNLAEWVKDQAIKNGADQVAVTLINRREISVEYRNKQIDQLQESTQNALSLQIYAQQRYSSHSTNDFRKDSLAKFIEEAVHSTRYLSEDPYRSLPDPKYYPSVSDVDLVIRDDGYEKIETSQRVEIAKEIEESARDQSKQIISVTSGYSDIRSDKIKLDSNGFFGHTEGTLFSAGAEVSVKGTDGDRPEDSFLANTRFFQEQPSTEEIGKKAAQQALRKIGQVSIDSGKYDMIVENRACGRILSLFQIPMSARAIQQKSSFLEGMLDKKIASDKLTMIDDPFLQKGLGSRYFDEEGLAAQKRIMIENGILRQYYVDNYYGRKLNMEPTSGSPSNIIFEYGEKSPEEIIKEMKKGILITGFIGGNSNPTTGDFSFGVVGLLVEDGQIIKPINEMNISGNAREFWNQLVEVGNDPYPFSSLRIPSMLFEDVHFSGI